MNLSLVLLCFYLLLFRSSEGCFAFGKLLQSKSAGKLSQEKYDNNIYKVIRNKNEKRLYNEKLSSLKNEHYLGNEINLPQRTYKVCVFDHCYTKSQLFNPTLEGASRSPEEIAFSYISALSKMNTFISSLLSRID